MAYSPGSIPLPPPPQNPAAARSFSNAYDLHKNTTDRVAQFGVAPVNQMTNQFGGRQGGNAAVSMRNAPSGGNRTSQHVVTGGNNNVGYRSQLQAAQTLWQKANNQTMQGGIPPANGMSYGFMKNTQARPIAPPPPVVSPPAPAPVSPINTAGTGLGGGGSQGQVIDANARMQEQKLVEQALQQDPLKSGVGTVPAGTPAPSPFQTKAQADAAWDRNKMGPKTFKDSAGRIRGTAEYIAFLTKHGFR